MPVGVFRTSAWGRSTHTKKWMYSSTLPRVISDCRWSTPTHDLPRLSWRVGLSSVVVSLFSPQFCIFLSLESVKVSLLIETNSILLSELTSIRILWSVRIRFITLKPCSHSALDTGITTIVMHSCFRFKIQQRNDDDVVNFHWLIWCASSPAVLWDDTGLVESHPMHFIQPNSMIRIQWNQTPLHFKNHVYHDVLLILYCLCGWLEQAF